MTPVIAITSAIWFLIPFAIANYYLVYSPIAFKAKWCKGRDFSVMFQGNTAGWTVSFLLGYSACRRLFGDDALRSFWFLVFGTSILVCIVTNYFATEFIAKPLRRHYGILTTGIAFGGMAFLFSAIAWIVGDPRPIITEVIFLSLSFLIIGWGEYSFLRANNWRFMPRDPK